MNEGPVPEADFTSCRVHHMLQFMIGRNRPERSNEAFGESEISTHRTKIRLKRYQAGISDAYPLVGFSST